MKVSWTGSRPSLCKSHTAPTIGFALLKMLEEAQPLRTARLRANPAGAGPVMERKSAGAGLVHSLHERRGMGDVLSNHGSAVATRAEALDAEHDELMALMNRIIKRDAESALKAELSLLVRQLLMRTEHHFTDEEAYMRDIAYARLDTHQIMHTQLLGALRTHVTEFEAGNGKLGTRLITFLKFWLMTHINGMDMGITRRASPASRPRPVSK